MTCIYKIDTGSDDSLMPIKIFKVLFSVTKIANLNKSIDMKIMYVHTTIHLYHKWVYEKQ